MHRPSWVNGPPMEAGVSQRAPYDPSVSSVVTRAIFAPSVEKLSVSRDFLGNAYDVVLAAGAGAQATIAEVQLPPDTVGWLQNLVYYVLTPTAATNILYRVLINGGPVPGFDNVLFPPAFLQVGIFTRIRLRVRVPNNALVQLVAVNRDAAGPWTVGGEISGWFHPSIAELNAWGLSEVG